MLKTTIDALNQALKSQPAAQQKLSEAAGLMLRGVLERRDLFEKNKKAIEDDIKRGSRLTNHRLPL